MKRIIFDIDNTLSFTTNGDYKNAEPNIPLIEKLREYKGKGYEIILSTSRNMRTYNSNIGKITAVTLPIIVEWLEKIMYLMMKFMSVNHGAVMRILCG